MNAESDVMVPAVHYRIVSAHVCEGPPGTATSNYVAKDGDNLRWFVKAYPQRADLGAERRAVELAEFAALGRVPVSLMRRTLDGNLIATAGGLEEVLRDLLR